MQSKATQTQVRTMEEIIELAKTNKGVDLSKIPVGTLLTVKTKDSTFELKTLSHNGEVLIQGSKYIPKQIKARVNGSTWGGSCLKMLWIGLNMRLEVAGFSDDPRSILTSAWIESIIIIGKDYQYELRHTVEQK